VLTSGHHGEVAKWRQAQRELTTRERRPDLWAAHLAKTAAEPGSAKSKAKGAKARGE
jgi:tRNA (guanine37-N1)-methyltransferase